MFFFLHIFLVVRPNYQFSLDEFAVIPRLSVQSQSPTWVRLVPSVSSGGCQDLEPTVDRWELETCQRGGAVAGDREGENDCTVVLGKRKRKKKNPAIGGMLNSYYS